MHDIVLQLATCILPVTGDTARTRGLLSATIRERGLAVAIGDGLIAATGLDRGMHVVIPNVKDLEPSGALLINPWE